MKKISVFIIGVVLSGVLFAQEAAAEGVVEGTIKTLTFYTPYGSSRTVTVELDGVPGPYCGTDASYDFLYIRESDGPSAFQPIVSALLAAKVSKVKVKIFSHEEDGACLIHRVRME